MTPAKLICPYAKYNQKMFIDCTKSGGLCAYQHWCAMKGWCELTEGAVKCKVREDVPVTKEVKTDERKAKAAPKRRNKV